MIIPLADWKVDSSGEESQGYGMGVKAFVMAIA